MPKPYVAYGPGFSGDYDTAVEAEGVVSANGSGAVYKLLRPDPFRAARVADLHAEHERLRREDAQLRERLRNRTEELEWLRSENIKLCAELGYVTLTAKRPPNVK